MSNVLWLIVLVTPIFVVSAIARNQRRRATVRSSTVAIRADAEGVSRTLSDGRREQVTWDEVMSVDVFTARMGPHKDAGGAVVLYGDATRGCVVPLDELGTSGLLEHIWRLPGFEIPALLRAIDVDERGPDTSIGGRGLLKGPPQRTTELWVRDPDADPGRLS